MTGYQIRNMEENDLFQVAALEQCIFSEPWSLKSIKDTFFREDTIYIVAVKDDIIIGYCCLWKVAEEGQIYNVAVAEEFRNKKVGTALLKELLNRGKKAAVLEFTLEVRKSNQYAIQLYQNFGFESAGIRKNFYRFPTEDAVIMWLRIK